MLTGYILPNRMNHLKVLKGNPRNSSSNRNALSMVPSKLGRPQAPRHGVGGRVAAEGGNRRGPTCACNVKELRHQETRIAERAEKSCEHFVAAWRTRPPGKERGCATASNRQGLDGCPVTLPADAPRFATRSIAHRKDSRPERKSLVDLIRRVQLGAVQAWKAHVG